MGNPLLNPTLKVKLDYLLRSLAERRLCLEVYSTARSPWEQAFLWRKSRSRDEVNRAITKLRMEGAHWLARVLEETPPVRGRWETNNLPGQSWHQWGEAADFRVLGEGNRVIWTPNHPAYEEVAQTAKKVNLYSGFFWKNRDAQHIQLRADAVRAYYAWSEIDQRMKERYHASDDMYRSLDRAVSVDGGCGSSGLAADG